MDDLGMSYVYGDMGEYRDKWTKRQDEYILREMGGKFLSELLESRDPFTVRLTKSDEPHGYNQRIVTFRLHVRKAETMMVRIPEVPRLEDMPTRFVAWNYKQELISRFNRFVHRSIHGY